ncbi:hypothetical protein E2P81_ATG11815 [Venturia nashicola]|nr:hypothetical protein E2P81_ATG11815 [Venturia nashicola]
MLRISLSMYKLLLYPQLPMREKLGRTILLLSSCCGPHDLGATRAAITSVNIQSRIHPHLRAFISTQHLHTWITFVKPLHLDCLRQASTPGLPSSSLYTWIAFVKPLHLDYLRQASTPGLPSSSLYTWITFVKPLHLDCLRQASTPGLPSSSLYTWIAFIKPLHLGYLHQRLLVHDGTPQGPSRFAFRCSESPVSLPLNSS